jgi:Tfp pilus assembly protein PilO
MNSIIGRYLKITLMIWGISLIFIIPAFVFVLRPQMRKVDNLRQENNRLTNEAFAAKLEAEESTRQGLQKQIDEMKSQFGRFVIKSKDDIQRLASLEIDDNMSNQIGLDTFRIDPLSGGEVRAFKDCKYVYGQTMKVTFNATYPQFAKFLNMLERYESVIFIDTFFITKENNKENKHQIEMNLVVLVEKAVPAKI